MNSQPTVDRRVVRSRLGAKPPQDHRSQGPQDAREWLSFRLGEEEYGVDILRVQEIRSYESPTRIAGAPDFIRGVLNLRGVIVPIVDLRSRLSLEPRFDPRTVTVVFNVAGCVVGAVVDSVSDVVELEAGQIEPPPQFSHAIYADTISGIGCLKQGDRQRLLILLNVEALLGGSITDPFEPALA
jgi:purine-binding chemotaxis protein CheW